MGAGAATVAHVPTGSILAVDERGIGLRATWRLSHGFINLSLWRDDVCIETFHLAPADAARIIGFLVEGLAEVATVTPAAPVLAVAPTRPVDGPTRVRREIARKLAPQARRPDRFGLRFLVAIDNERMYP